MLLTVDNNNESVCKVFKKAKNLQKLIYRKCFIVKKGREQIKLDKRFEIELRKSYLLVLSSSIRRI